MDPQTTISLMSGAAPTALSPTAPKTGSFSPDEYLLALLEDAVGHTLRGSENWEGKIDEVVTDLRPEDRGQLIRFFGRAQYEALLALKTETVPELFFDELLRLGRRLGEENRPAAAMHIFHRVEANDSFSQAVERARQYRTELQGGGSFGARAESFFRSFAREAGDFRSLLPVLAGCFAGSALYNISRQKFARYLGRALEARAQMTGGIAPIEIVKMRAQSRGMALLLGAGASTLAEHGLVRLAGEGSIDSGEEFLRAYGDSLLRLFLWRFSVGLSDMHRLDWLNQPKFSAWMTLERCAFSQAAGAAALGLSMAISPHHSPETGPAMLAQLLYELVGMNAGRFAGRLGSRLLSSR